MVLFPAELVWFGCWQTVKRVFDRVVVLLAILVHLCGRLCVCFWIDAVCQEHGGDSAHGVVAHLGSRVA